MGRMINEHLCFDKLGRCCKHLPHGGRWAGHQQGKDRDLKKSNDFNISRNTLITWWAERQQCEDLEIRKNCFKILSWFLDTYIWCH